MSINLDAMVFGLRNLHPFLACSSIHGRVMIFESKNVKAPVLGAVGINTVHPNAVFDTGLGIEINSKLVAKTVIQLIGPAFAAATGAQIAVDGGSDRTL